MKSNAVFLRPGGLAEGVLGPPENHVTVALAAGHIGELDVERAIACREHGQYAGDRRVVTDVLTEKDEGRHTRTHTKLITQGLPGRNPAVTDLVLWETVGILVFHGIDAFPVATFVEPALAQAATPRIFGVAAALFGRIRKGHVIRPERHVEFDIPLFPDNRQVFASGVPGLAVPGLAFSSFAVALGRTDAHHALRCLRRRYRVRARRCRGG